MGKTSIHVALEIGTSKTCMVVGEIRSDGSAAIIGIGEAKSVGIRRGEIVDLNYASQCVRDAWGMAQDNADVEIRSIHLAVTGDHFVGQNTLGSYRLPDQERTVTHKHMQIVKEKAANLEVSADRFIIARINGKYSVDGREPSESPARLTARTLDMKSHIIHGIESRIHNSIICARQVPLEVTNLVFAPVATAYAVLNKDQRDAGALVIDIGAGTTDYVCYLDGAVVASGSFPVGGANINQDVNQLTNQRVSKEAAEVLKCTEGDAFGDTTDKTSISYTGEHGLHSCSMPRGMLNRIIRDRLEEILKCVRARLPEEAREKGRISVYLSGGTSMMRGLGALAEHVFECRVSQPAYIDKEQEDYEFLQDPRYCTAVGLIRMAQVYELENELNKPSIFSRLLSYFTRR